MTNESHRYTQSRKAWNGDAEAMKAMCLSIGAERVKMQKPVTGSGGMLIGTVKAIGPNFNNPTKVKVGDQIATLVSLSLTPLRIDKIKNLQPDSDQVAIEGEAILFESGLFAALPNHTPEHLALAVFDVAGSPAHAGRLVTQGDSVVILCGCGRS